jgi:hypothetical protein
MSVNAAGPGYLGSFSPLLVYPAHAVSVSMSAFKVVYGKSFNLSGRVSGAKPGLGVAILARPFMQADAQQVATIRTGTSGSWSYRITPPFTTSYQVRWGNTTSRALTIGVRPAMSVRMLSGDRVWAHVSLMRRMTGRSLQVQKRTAGVWKTVSKVPLDVHASAILTPSMLPAGTSTLRTAISVNQAGAGYLGGFSKPFIYHR